MKKTLGSFGKKRLNASGEVPLQITSMADIFTILLVFLLKSFSTGATTLTPTAGLILPAAQAAEPSAEALRIEVSENAVLIEGRPVAPLKNFRLERSPAGAQGTIPQLVAEFEKERKRQLLVSKADSNVKVDGRMIVLSDRRVPYGTLKAVLASGAVQGFTDFKLAVNKGD